MLSIPAGPIVVRGPALSRSPNTSDNREERDNYREEDLKVCKIKAAPHNLDWLAIPMQSAVRIDTQAVHFRQCDTTDAPGPRRFIHLLKRHTLKIFLSLLVQSSDSLFVGLHALFSLTCNPISPSRQ
jgi:hypothetical protein